MKPVLVKFVDLNGSIESCGWSVGSYQVCQSGSVKQAQGRAGQASHKLVMPEVRSAKQPGWAMRAQTTVDPVEPIGSIKPSGQVKLVKPIVPIRSIVLVLIERARLRYLAHLAHLANLTWTIENMLSSVP